MASKKEPFLRDYQMDAIKKMKNGCILNGGVGSGKSRTGLYYYFKEQGGSIDPDYKPMKKTRDLYIITTAMKRDSLEFEGELAMAISKYFFDNKNYYYDVFKEWLPKEEKKVVQKPNLQDFSLRLYVE